MDIEKYTSRVQTLIQNAQNYTLTCGHQQVLPEHLVHAMLQGKSLQFWSF